MLSEKPGNVMMRFLTEFKQIHKNKMNGKVIVYRSNQKIRTDEV